MRNERGETDDYESRTEILTQLIPAPNLKRSSVYSVIADNMIYLFGPKIKPGFENESTEIFENGERYDIEAGAWELIPNTHIDRTNFALVGVPNGNIYALGGYPVSQPLIKMSFVPLRSLTRQGNGGEWFAICLRAEVITQQ